jgi:predicted TIM-barrel fold metal-dependent hydrolase
VSAAGLSSGPASVPPGAATAGEAWDCHVHVFDSSAPVRPGHYQPSHQPLAAIEAVARAHGLQRLVLVQPSVYGTDPTVLLAALQAGQGRHRGVAVLDADADDRLIDRLHAAGVRGIRFNLVSPAGHATDVDTDLRRLAPRLRERGWHVQWYVHAVQLPQVVAWQAEHRLSVVLDHLAGLHADLQPGADLPAAGARAVWAAADALADAGAWVKLSGWYRLRASAPYGALLPQIRRVAERFGPRLVWGSDWPHTSFETSQMPAYASLLAPLRAALDEASVRRALVEAPAALYGAG